MKLKKNKFFKKVKLVKLANRSMDFIMSNNMVFSEINFINYMIKKKHRQSHN
jgi:hypothetical protein